MTQLSDVELINKSLDKFLDSEVLQAKIEKYTQHAHRDIIHMVYRPALLVGGTLFTVIMGLIVFIFVTSNNNVLRLADETKKLSSIVSAFDERSKNNQRNIDIILEKIGDKRD